jgi:hypothetical protein
MAGNAVQIFVAAFDDETQAADTLKQVGESLPPGGSAVIAIAEDRVVEQPET